MCLPLSCMALIPQAVGDKYPKAPIFGLLLGDGFLVKVDPLKPNINSRLQYEQSTIHEAYLEFVHITLVNAGVVAPKGLQCGKISYSSRLPDTRARSAYSRASFYAGRDTFWTVLRNVFYINGIKSIPSNQADFFTVRAPQGAFWIQDDGYAASNGLRLATHSFTLEEVNYLIIKLLQP